MLDLAVSQSQYAAAMVLRYLAIFLAALVASATGFHFYYSHLLTEALEQEYGFSRVTRLLEQDQEQQKATPKTRDDRLYLFILGQKVDQLVDGLQTDREKAVAIAQWIGTKWRNASVLDRALQSHSSGSKLDQTLYRTGACANRSTIFVHMAELAGLRAKLFSIYNFGRVGDGHTAVQVYYDDGWRFFDPSYAGFFEKEGRILSFQEILSEKDQALSYLVPIGRSGDVWYKSRWNPLTWRPVDNTRRMSKVYAPKNLARAHANGFVGDPTPITLKFSMTPGDQLGSIDQGNRDVYRDVRKFQKSEQLERMGFTSVPFFQQIDLTNLKPETTYSYELSTYRSNLKEAHEFAAEATGCKIVSGGKFSGSGTWKIRLNSHAESCKLTIKHNIFDRARYVLVDQISFKESDTATE